ncbi:MAG: DUF1385 domain-containing protein [Firmicutes bacterium]|nr:DUF1385 domain-containing protein [Bacillota bacterium]
MKTDFQYGGQAVIEGVMMRGRECLAVAVRKSGGEVVVHKEPVGRLTKKYPILKLPFLRGIVALCDSFVLGLKALLFSANQFVEEEDQGELTPLETGLMVGAALLLTVVLFILLPLGLRSLVSRLTAVPFWLNLAEGLVRALILVLYILLVTRLKDIQRVFAYHGAEHKVIHAYEAGEELTVANAQRYGTVHPRCGTSFLLFVVVVSAVLFSLLGRQTALERILSRILLLPVVAGISYELIKLAGSRSNFFPIRWLSAPGLWLQRLTTKPPDDSMVEVAITALRAVLAEDGRTTARLSPEPTEESDLPVIA